MNPLHDFDAALQLASSRIQSAKHEDLLPTRRAYGYGIVQGYYLTGCISLDEEEDAFKQLDRAVAQRRALLLLEQQARAEGLA